MQMQSVTMNAEITITEILSTKNKGLDKLQ